MRGRNKPWAKDFIEAHDELIYKADENLSTNELTLEIGIINRLFPKSIGVPTIFDVSTILTTESKDILNKSLIGCSFIKFLHLFLLNLRLFFPSCS